MVPPARAGPGSGIYKGLERGRQTLRRLQMLTASHGEGRPAPSARIPREARSLQCAPQSWERGREKKHMPGTRGRLLVPEERHTSSYKPAALAGRRGENEPQDGLVRDKGCPGGGTEWTWGLGGEKLLQVWGPERERQEGTLTLIHLSDSRRACL